MIENINLTEIMKDEIAVFLKAIDQKNEEYIKKLKTENESLRERNRQLESFHEADKTLIAYFSNTVERYKKANDVYKHMVERLEAKALDRPAIEQEFRGKVHKAEKGICLERNKAKNARVLATAVGEEYSEDTYKCFLNQSYYDGYAAGIKMCLRHIGEMYK